MQGCIKSAENKHTEAIALLNQALEKEKELGYSEPPVNARPVLLSLAGAYEKVGELDKAWEAYEKRLTKYPNSANG